MAWNDIQTGRDGSEVGSIEMADTVMQLRKQNWKEYKLDEN